GNAARNDLASPASVGTPANCSGVIAVGATDARKQQTYYSNSGAALTLMAPGGDPSQSTTGTGYPDGIYSTLGNFDASGTRIPSFGLLAGTSMATPHVAGVMALMRYVYPSITPAQIDTLIAAGLMTDDLGVAGRDDATGYGLINARKAVEQALALASSSSTAPTGIVIASPASISFGSTATSASLELKTTATTTETVSSIVSSTPAVTIAANSIDATTKLGTYTVSVDRTSLPVGTSFPILTVNTSTRTFTVQLTVIKNAVVTSSQANYGRVLVSIENAGTGTKLGQSNVFASGGKYAWSISGIPAGQIRIIAGTNLDNDGVYCKLGEVCGRYPDPSTSITVGGNLSGMDFPIAPTGTTTTSTLDSAASHVQ
ncbi:MAG: hypothetical protein JWM03_1394, partial [Rhodocyclales bacterium]|nr:hypothetical protein [Rhodocyclales bacterium]